MTKYNAVECYLFTIFIISMIGFSMMGIVSFTKLGANKIIDTKEVSCYDKYNNIISNVTCYDYSYDFSDKQNEDFKQFFMFFSTMMIISFIGLCFVK